MPDPTTPTRLLLPGEQEALALLAASREAQFQPEDDRPVYTITGWAKGDPRKASFMADALIEQCGAVDAAAAEVQAQAAEYRARIDAWEEDELRRASLERGRLVGLLRVYADETFPQALRTIRRPTGDMERTAGFEEIKFIGTDEEMIAWLRVNDLDGYDRHVNMVEKLSRTSLKKDLDKMGEYTTYKPLGVAFVMEDRAGDVAVETKLAQVETRPDTFRVKPNKPKALPAAAPTLTVTAHALQRFQERGAALYDDRADLGEQAHRLAAEALDKGKLDDRGRIPWRGLVWCFEENGSVLVTVKPENDE